MQKKCHLGRKRDYKKKIFLRLFEKLEKSLKSGEYSGSSLRSKRDLIGV